MLNAKLKPMEEHDGRSAARYRLLLHANANFAEAGSGDVVVHDLSSTGFLIECDVKLPKGAELNLELPGPTSAVGEVIWSSGKFFGGEFRSPLGPAALESARSSSAVVWPEFVATSIADRRPSEQSLPAAAMELDPEAQIEVPGSAGPILLIIAGTSILLWLPIAIGIWSLFA